MYNLQLLCTMWMLASSPDLQYTNAKYGGRVANRITLTAVQKINACSYMQEVVIASHEHDVDFWKLLALIYVESTWTLNAVSNRGACGLTQIIPRYHRDKHPGLTCEDLINDPRTAIHLTAVIIRQHYERFNSYARSLEAYNAGPARVIDNNVPLRTISYRNKIIAISVFLKRTYRNMLRSN